MNKSKKILGSLIVVTLAVSMTACGFGKNDELEPAEVVTATPTPSPTPKPKVTATPTPTPTPVPELANKTVYANDNVNVRASAATDGEIVGSLQPGESVTALDNPKDGWVRIQLDGADGYVKEEYITQTAPEGTAEYCSEQYICGFWYRAKRSEQHNACDQYSKCGREWGSLRTEQ